MLWKRVGAARGGSLGGGGDHSLVKDVLTSDAGLDYVPLANMLLIGDFKSADQFTRDVLIKLAGPGAVKRGYVYFTEVRVGGNNRTGLPL
jgi:hypothetical protein